MAAVFQEVRQAAGTARMLPILDDYLDAAEAAQGWTLENGEELFSQPAAKITKADGACHTLSTFFERYYLPICLSDGSPHTIELYRVTIRKWEALTGNPPLKEITTETLAKFGDVLSRLRKSNRHKLNPITARNYQRMVQILLDKAGPPARKNRDAAGFIDASPWTKLPRVEWPLPKIVPSDHLAACYEAADGMELPKIEGVSPPDWWRALLALVYNTGLRRRTLFGLRWEHVDFEARVLRIPAELLKARRSQIVPMNDVVCRHLRVIQGDRPLVLGWPHSAEWFRANFRRLQVSAGLLSPKQFGLHRMRKTCATMLWKKDPAAAQLMLGHTALATTKQHYIDATESLAGVVKDLPQPEGFEGQV
ncbi:MAG: tyrosine-type recombinase/integrase [Pirellulaceae bacterium]|nr:tyrosine-type recombinase/integrase [Pirellulaceae bacterium]